MNLSSSITIVTGGASGLGGATTRELAANGAKVMIFDVNATKGEALANELGANVAFSRVDVTSEESVQAGIAGTLEQFGGVSACVNCAGIGVAMKTMGKNGAHRLDLFKKVIDINLVGTFNVLRLAAEEMSKNQPNAEGERGVIINTASVAAYEGQKGQVAYSASKGAIVAMTLPIARDLAFYGIRVCAIAPGLFFTPLFEGLGEEVVNSLSAQVTFPKRLGRPEEFATLARTIVEQPYFNGETVRLDGAIRLP